MLRHGRFCTAQLSGAGGRGVLENGAAVPFDILMRAVPDCIRMPNEQRAGVLQGTLDGDAG